MKCILLMLAVVTLASSPKRVAVNANALRDTFAETLELSLEANRLSQPPEGQSSFQMSKTQEERMLSLIDRLVQKGEGLNPKFLAWLHKDLPTVYKDKLIEGQKLYARGIRTSNPTLQIKGNQLFMQWWSFWEKHKSTITAKMYPTPEAK